METMLSYSWPGNIRELENCIERACVIGKSSLIQSEDLLLEKAGTIAVQENESDRNLKTALNLFKTRYIKKVSMRRPFLVSGLKLGKAI
jgi:Nif-specific regulatory protein